MARVSVIVAARDAAATLPQALASVAAQTFGDWEVILVDDGSTDATAEVAAGFDAGPLRLLRHETARGPAAARNRAVAAAGGELIALLDADDEWLPERLERQIALYDEARAAGRRAGLVAADARLRGPDGRLAHDTWAGRVGPVEPATLAHLLAGNRICSATTLLPRAVFEELGGFDAAIWRGEDYDLWLRLLEAEYEILGAPEPLAIYRFSPTGLTSASAQIASSTRAIYAAALRRGRLGRREQRIAQRQVRMFRLLEARASERHGLQARLGLLALALRVAAEHPDRWRHWLRRGPRRPARGRHA